METGIGDLRATFSGFSKTGANDTLNSMCRFALYLGDPITLSSLLTEPSNSIIHQSYQSQHQEEPLNGDGFGVAWYAPELWSEPALFRDVRPAWNNLNLTNLAKVTRSRCILAHVRAATPGFPVVELNCHPFKWRHFSFMHNGRIEGFDKLRRPLLQKLSDEAFDMIQGSTDSEHLLALFSDKYRAEQNHDDDRTRPMAAALRETIREVLQLRSDHGIDRACLLNLAICDGTSAVVTRFVSPATLAPNSLYYRYGESYECSQGEPHLSDADNGRHAVLVASEPLSDDEEWVEVPSNQMVRIDEKLRLTLEDLPGL